MVRKLREKDGAAVIEMGIGIFVVCLILCIVLQTIGVLIYRYQMGTCADKIADLVAAEGCYDSSVQQTVSNYLETTNVSNATVSLSGTDYMGSTKKVQLNDEIIVTIQSDYNIGFNFISISINLKNIAKARSGVYWK